MAVSRTLSSLNLTVLSVLTFSLVLGPVQTSRAQESGESKIVKAGDVNGDGRQDISDAVFLMNYLFRGGPDPVEIFCGPAVGFTDMEFEGTPQHLELTVGSVEGRLDGFLGVTHDGNVEGAVSVHLELGELIVVVAVEGHQISIELPGGDLFYLTPEARDRIITGDGEELELAGAVQTLLAEFSESDSAFFWSGPSQAIAALGLLGSTSVARINVDAALERGVSVFWPNFQGFMNGLFAFPAAKADLKCTDTITYTMKGICALSAAAAETKAEGYAKPHYNCPDAVNCPNVDVSGKAGKKGKTCVYNIPSLKYGNLYDVTLTIKCKK